MMLDFYKLNLEFNQVDDLPSIPDNLSGGLGDEALVWVPGGLDKDQLKKCFSDLPILDNKLVVDNSVTEGFWLRTSTLNEPSFLSLSAKEFGYIVEKMNVSSFGLEVYLWVQKFCQEKLGAFFDKNYWTWLPGAIYDKSGLLIGGINKLGKFDFHAWMPDFQATFCGGRYYYIEKNASKESSLISLEWEYDKREMSFKHWSGEIEKGGEVSKFAAYHLIRDFEIMKFFKNIYTNRNEVITKDLEELYNRWNNKMSGLDIKKIFELAFEQVKQYNAMLDDLVGYIISGIKNQEVVTPYRVNNGLKNLRNYYLVISKLRKEIHDPLLENLHDRLKKIIQKINALVEERESNKKFECMHLYFGMFKYLSLIK